MAKFNQWRYYTLYVVDVQINCTNSHTTMHSLYTSTKAWWDCIILVIVFSHQLTPIPVTAETSFHWNLMVKSTSHAQWSNLHYRSTGVRQQITMHSESLRTVLRPKDLWELSHNIHVRSCSSPTESLPWLLVLQASTQEVAHSVDKGITFLWIFGLHKQQLALYMCRAVLNYYFYHSDVYPLL